jgi:aspartate 1-decarboxylase
LQRQMLKSKIHRATVTGCDPDYVGSITLDPELMRSADVIPNEQVYVWDIDNGARFVTYVIEDEPGTGAVQVNGAAARLVSEGDKVIVASFGAYDERDLRAYAPIVVHVDDRNRIARVDSHPEVLFETSRARSQRAPGAGFSRARHPGSLDSSLASEADFEIPGSLIHEGSYR